MAISGNQLPGALDGVTFAAFGGGATSANDPPFALSPTISSSGSIVFSAILQGTGVNSSNNSGAFREDGGTQLSSIARRGDLLPTPNDPRYYKGIGYAMITNTGMTVFTADASDASARYGFVPIIAVDVDGSGAKPVLLTNAPLPGAPHGIALSDRIKASGHQIAVRSKVLTPDGRTGPYAMLLVDANGTTSLLPREGQIINGLPLDLAIDSIGLMGVNRRGETSETASLRGPGVTSQNEDVLFTGGLSGLTHLIARSGDDLPSQSLGLPFEEFYGGGTLNDRGDLVWKGTVRESGSQNSTVYGVYHGLSGVSSPQELLFKSGDAVSGIDGVNLGSRANYPLINRSGAVAIVSLLSGEGVSLDRDLAMLIRGDDARLRIVVREGDQAPSLPEGYMFSSFTSPALNAAGQLAFSAKIKRSTGGLVDAIYATDRDGVLNLIAATDLPVDVNNSQEMEDIRIVRHLSTITATGNEDGIGTSFNDLGQVTFYADFNNATSGVFVSSKVAVPEPCALSLIVLGLVVNCCGLALRC